MSSTRTYKSGLYSKNGILSLLEETFNKDNFCSEFDGPMKQDRETECSMFITRIDGYLKTRMLFCKVRLKSHQMRWSVNVSAGTVGDQVIEPYFFLDSVMSEAYLHLLRDVSLELLDDVPYAIRLNLIIQQDEAAPHFSRAGTNSLNEKYHCWIGRSGKIAWPP